MLKGPIVDVLRHLKRHRCTRGGGGDEPPPSVQIDITAANRDNVCHATVAGVLALSPTGAMIPLATASRGAGQWMSAMLRPPNRWISGASTRRERAQAVYAPYDCCAEMCPGGGQVRVWDDDRDESSADAPTVGDVMALAFESCKDGVGGTATGTMVIALTHIRLTPVPP